MFAYDYDVFSTACTWAVEYYHQVVLGPSLSLLTIFFVHRKTPVVQEASREVWCRTCAVVPCPKLSHELKADGPPRWRLIVIQQEWLLWSLRSQTLHGTGIDAAPLTPFSTTPGRFLAVPPIEWQGQTRIHCLPE